MAAPPGAVAAPAAPAAKGGPRHRARPGWAALAAPPVTCARRRSGAGPGRAARSGRCGQHGRHGRLGSLLRLLPLLRARAARGSAGPGRAGNAAAPGPAPPAAPPPLRSARPPPLPLLLLLCADTRTHGHTERPERCGSGPAHAPQQAHPVPAPAALGAVPVL